MLKKHLRCKLAQNVSHLSLKPKQNKISGTYLRDVIIQNERVKRIYHNVHSDTSFIININVIMVLNVIMWSLLAQWLRRGTLCCVGKFNTRAVQSMQSLGLVPDHTLTRQVIVLSVVSNYRSKKMVPGWAVNVHVRMLVMHPRELQYKTE